MEPILRHRTLTEKINELTWPQTITIMVVIFFPVLLLFFLSVHHTPVGEEMSVSNITTPERVKRARTDIKVLIRRYNKMGQELDAPIKDRARYHEVNEERVRLAHMLRSVFADIAVTLPYSSSEVQPRSSRGKIL